MLRKVLVVDDSGLNRKILNKLLSKDYTVIEAVNGKEALDLLNTQYSEISAILLDIIMPVMDGYEFLRQVGKNSNISQIPVIVTTGDKEKGTEEKALELGAIDYITKPYNPEIIKCRLGNTIKLRETAAIVNATKIDPLTGIYSRTGFFEKAEELIKSHEPGYYVIGNFDIDKFKVINDLYGNEKGDEVLKFIANKFKTGFSEKGGICCRIVADSFGVLYPKDLLNTGLLNEICLSATRFDGSILPMIFSIGRYVVDDLSIPVSTMFDRAAIAMASVKGNYGKHIAQYDSSMRERLLQEQKIVSEMNIALKNREFEVWLQPQHNHSNGALIGAEALVRWRDRESGKLKSPATFMPVFEKNGFVYELDKFVWEEVCKLLKRWKSNGLCNLPVSVNISRFDALQEDVVDVITGLVQKYDLPVDLLRLEITESAFTESVDKIINVVQAFVDAGFIVEIDDFGSGYSSLNTLKDVPANVVKLDMRFLDDKGNSSRGGNILESIVRMTKWLGMAVIAEGVETRAQADYLESIGCNYVQGYLYAKPKPVNEYEMLIKECPKETKKSQLETVNSLDNDAFWNPESIETLIFNSYVGGARVFEYYNGKTETLRVNKKFAKIIGGENMTADEALNFHFSDHMEPDEYSNIIQLISNTVENRTEVYFDCELKNMRDNGESIYLHCSLRLIANTDNRFLFYCTIEDFTPRRHAEIKKEQALNQLKFLNNTAHELLIETDTKSGIEHILTDLLGYFNGDRSYVIELNNKKQTFCNTYEVCADGIESEKGLLMDLPMHYYSSWIKAFEEHKHISIKNVADLPDSRGEERDILLEQGITSLTAVPMQRNGKLIGFLGVDNPRQNVENVKRLAAIGDFAAAFTIRRELLQKIEIDNSMIANLMGDMPGGFTHSSILQNGRFSGEYVNDGFCRMLGMSRDEVMKHFKNNITAFVHPEDLISIENHIRSMVAVGGSHSISIRMRKKSGEYLWVVALCRIVTDTSGNTFLNIYYSDVSDQKHYEAEQRVLIENLPNGVGMYNYYTDGRLEQVYLNNGYYKLIGVKRDDRKNYNGFSVIEAVHPEDVLSIVKKLKDAVESNRAIRLEARILTGNGEYKWFEIRANIASKSQDKYVLIASYSDIDQLKTTKLNLEASQKALKIASENSKITLWVFNIKERTIRHQLGIKSPLGYPDLLENVPESMCESGAVDADCCEQFLSAYNRIIDGNETAECTVKFKNIHNGAYEWHRMQLTLLEGKEKAIGIAINIDKSQQQYIRELQLRHSLLRESVLFYQLNLSTNIIEEFYSKFTDIPSMKSMIPITDEIDKEILNNVDGKYWRALQRIFAKGLRKAYKNGEEVVTAVYLRDLGERKKCWVKTTAVIMQRPQTNETIAFIYCQDIDRSEKDQVAIQNIMNEEIESVGVLNVKDNLIHFVKIQRGYDGYKKQEDYNYKELSQKIILTEVIDSDRKICEEFFSSESLIQRLSKESVVKCAYRIMGDNGKIMRKKARAFYLDETHRDIIIIRRDITDLYEEEQRQKRKLQDAVKKVTAANHAKSEFLSRMSHDMRTPLNAVLAFSGDEMVNDSSESEIRGYLKKIHSSGDYLLGIINDVLDMSKIEQNKVILHSVPYSINEFSKMVNAVIGELSKNKKINFVFDIKNIREPNVLVDKVRFEQIFINLLSNAIKFTPSGGTVEFTIECEYKQGDKFGYNRFVVKDTGIGMDPEFVPHAFESFAQEYHRDISQNNQGTGLGLAIVKELVTLMNGKISLESKLGKGTTFTVELPLEITGEYPEKIAKSDKDLSLENMRILLCEDNFINTEIAVRLLKKQGCIVECAENGKVGSTKFAESPVGYYNAVLMDIRMPVMDGIESCMEIRKCNRPDSATIPIIAMTADAFTEDEMTAFKSGMNDYIAKPIVPAILFSTLKKYYEKEMQ